MNKAAAASVQVEHDIMVSAPADAVYRLIADVENWPDIFPPTVYVDYVERAYPNERIRIWATANGEAKNWVSRRRLNRTEGWIEFRQEVSAPPVAAMGGTWIVEPISAAECHVRLRHDYRAVDDAPESLRWIEQAVDRNSRSELSALKAAAELASGADQRMFSFDDTVKINGAAKDVYDFINEAGFWSERLPHVARVALHEETPGLQVLEMDTVAKDGSTHTTKSIRVCFPHHKIVYKQTTLPALMSLHTGAWTLRESGDVTIVTSRHTVVINTANVAKVLGAGADLAAAKRFVHNALSTNSLTTLEHARTYAERRR